uniref:Uncharacterized protein n=1 Tax=Callorhinchus milii TaxID=7868 RepID=A0A4W3J5V4_CALMI
GAISNSRIIIVIFILRYDPRHNKWLQIQSLQQPHADHCICAVGDCLYAIAGRDYHQELNVVERYNSRLNTWEYVAPLKKEVYAHAGTVHAGKVYIACGRSGRNYLKDLLCYDPETNHWESKADAPVERAWHGMATVREKLYLLGGSNNVNGYRQDIMHVSFQQKTNFIYLCFYNQVPHSFQRQNIADAGILK